MEYIMNLVLARWFIDNCIKGFVLAAFVAATKFFISGTHIGEPTFLVWWIGGVVLFAAIGILDAVNRVNLIMEAMNKNEH
jgi:hypothetical protein